MKSNGDDQKKVDKLLDDYRKINQALLQVRETESKFQLYFNLVNLINQIADYVIPKENPVRERIGAVMGGQILQLASEKYIEEGRTQGIEEGRTQEVYSMVQDGDTTPERAAKRLKITVLELRKQMLDNGYQYPEA